MTSGVITHIQRFPVHDGPGIRTTVFLKGCQMRCPWGHNPQTYRRQPEIQVFPERCIGCRVCATACQRTGHEFTDSAHVYHRDRCVACGECVETRYAQSLVRVCEKRTAESIVSELLADPPFYQQAGGATLSGGEPLLQAAFAAEILQFCRREGLNTAVETNLAWPWHVVPPLVPLVDLFLVDVKIMDDGVHRIWTGMSNRQTLDNLRRLDSLHKALVVRTPVVVGVNQQPEQIQAIADFLATLPSVRYYELLPYHPLGSGKHEALGWADPGGSLVRLQRRTSTPGGKRRMARLRRQGSRHNVHIAFALPERRNGWLGRETGHSAGRGTTMPAAVSGCQPGAYTFPVTRDSFSMTLLGPTELDYASRLERLRQRKEAQTAEKLRRIGYMNEDDYGMVLPPEDFVWRPKPNHPNGSFYGLQGWADNFCDLLEHLPVYVDPMDAQAGRYMVLLYRLRKLQLAAGIRLCRVEAGPGASRNHLGDRQRRPLCTRLSHRFGIGLGGPAGKDPRCRVEHGLDKAEFYGAEERVVRRHPRLDPPHGRGDRSRPWTRETDPTLKANLREMAEVNRWLIEVSWRTLREACQWIAWFTGLPDLQPRRRLCNRPLPHQAALPVRHPQPRWKCSRGRCARFAERAVTPLLAVAISQPSPENCRRPVTLSFGPDVPNVSLLALS